MRALLAIAAAGEAAMGLTLLVYPPIVARLLFGADMTGLSLVLGRIGGIALIALGVACWPGGTATRALCGMLTYSVLVTPYLACIGFARVYVGKLLWPAVALHLVLTLLLARAWFKAGKPKQPNLSTSK